MARTPIWRRYLRLFGADVTGDVEDEIRFHLETKTEELVREGWSPEAARRETARRFGDLATVRAYCETLGKGTGETHAPKGVLEGLGARYTLRFAATPARLGHDAAGSNHARGWRWRGRGGLQCPLRCRPTPVTVSRPRPARDALDDTGGPRRRSHAS